jgi:hypothetical protein
MLKNNTKNSFYWGIGALVPSRLGTRAPNQPLQNSFFNILFFADYSLLFSTSNSFIIDIFSLVENDFLILEGKGY